MMEDLDLLGAEGLSGEFITLRIKSIDKQKLGQALGGGAKAAALPAALAVVDFAPKHALEMALPFAVQKARDEYGVDLDYQISSAPPPAGEKPKSGSTGKGLLMGAALGAGGCWAAGHFGLLGMARSAIGRFF